MKKTVIFLILISFFSYIKYREIKKVHIEKIDISLKENEKAFVFLTSEDYKGLLLLNEKEDNLFLFKVNDFNKMQAELGKFLVKNLVVYGTYNESFPYKYKGVLQDMQIGDMQVFKKDNVFIFKAKYYNLCLFDKESTSIPSSCDFVYFLSLEKVISISEDVKGIFYDGSVQAKYKENAYTKWLDIYDLDDNAYTILKFYENSFEVITILK
jgi:hypothetical protein